MFSGKIYGDQATNNKFHPIFLNLYAVIFVTFKIILPLFLWVSTGDIPDCSIYILLKTVPIAESIEKQKHPV